MKSFTLGLAQIQIDGGDRDANLRRAEASLREFAALGANIVLLPEAMNLGWTHPSCLTKAEPIPQGVVCQHLAHLAKELKLYIVSGLIEQTPDAIYNSAILIDPSGDIILRHRKINELEIAQDCYARGRTIQVAETTFARIGIMICADGFADHLAISRSLAQMGAEVILSPCAWAVPPDFDPCATPYGQLWLESYEPVCREYGLWIAGCSNVGPIEAGPWQGHQCIGNSIVMGPEGKAVLTGPYSQTVMMTIEISPHRPSCGLSA